MVPEELFCFLFQPLSFLTVLIYGQKCYQGPGAGLGDDGRPETSRGGRVNNFFRVELDFL